MSDTALVWFRRDLRVRDQPTFLAARDAAKTALALFVLDPALLDPAGAARRTYLYRSLRALDASLGGRLLVVRGDPTEVVPEVAKAVDAATVHVAADFGPYGSKRDEAVAKALAEDERELVRTGSPYAVAPGRVRKDDGDPFKVFTPFRRAWAQHGWRKPADTDADTLEWQKPSVKGAVPIPDDESLDADLPEAGEDAAHERWRDFLDGPVADYGPARNRPDKPGTSRMSVHLKYGEIHPRTMLADLARRRSESVETYRTEIAWREFYADILHQRPDSARRNYDRSFDALPLASGKAAQEAFDAWRAGRTGFPIVDAGHAPAPGGGVDAQPGADDRGELPREGPAPAVVVGRAALHEVARRRRPRLEPTRVAVDGGQRHRRVAVLPRVQPGHAGREVRPGRRLRASLRA